MFINEAKGKGVDYNLLRKSGFGLVSALRFTSYLVGVRDLQLDCMIGSTQQLLSMHV